MENLHKYCRLCGSVLAETPMLSYENMPSVAQHLPSAETLQLDRGVRIDVVECLRCGLTQLTNDPVPYYKEVIRAVGFSAEMREFRLQQFGAFVRKYKLAEKKVLEVGCGKGEYLSLMKECGVDAVGIEYGEESVRACKEQGLIVSRGCIESEDVIVEGAPFDAFFMMQFLEHLPHPSLALRGIAKNLREGGVGIVEVPNFDMMLKEGMFAEFMRDHLAYFTKQTLTTMLAVNGFEILSVEEIWHDYILSAVVRKRRRTDTSLFLGSLSSMKQAIDKFLSEHKDVAIWGAGHQAFAVMSLVDLGGRVKYVVDSAPFKQGKFTPTTHIPIVGPEALSHDPVRALIIMAGSYAEEIKKIVQGKFGNSMQIAILRGSDLEITS